MRISEVAKFCWITILSDEVGVAVSYDLTVQELNFLMYINR